MLHRQVQPFLSYPNKLWERKRKKQETPSLHQSLPMQPQLHKRDNNNNNNNNISSKKERKNTHTQASLPRGTERIPPRGTCVTVFFQRPFVYSRSSVRGMVYLPNTGCSSR